MQPSTKKPGCACCATGAQTGETAMGCGQAAASLAICSNCASAACAGDGTAAYMYASDGGNTSVALASGNTVGFGFCRRALVGIVCENIEFVALEPQASVPTCVGGAWL